METFIRYELQQKRPDSKRWLIYARTDKDMVEEAALHFLHTERRGICKRAKKNTGRECRLSFRIVMLTCAVMEIS